MTAISQCEHGRIPSWCEACNPGQLILRAVTQYAEGQPQIAPGWIERMGPIKGLTATQVIVDDPHAPDILSVTRDVARGA